MAVDFYQIGQRIQAKRKSLGKTQENMAEALSVTVGYISQIERGITKINLEMLASVSDYLGVEIAELLSGASVNSGSYLSDELSKSFSKLNPKNKKLMLEISKLLGENQQA